MAIVFKTTNYKFMAIIKGINLKMRRVIAEVCTENCLLTERLSLSGSLMVMNLYG